MRISAAQARSMGAGTRVVEMEYANVLRAIQDVITVSGRDGLTACNVPVPVNFSAGALSNSSAQTIIYHKIITELESKGFQVRINMAPDAPDNVSFDIRWDVADDSADLEQMHRNIARHRVPIRARIPARVAQTQTPAPPKGH